MVKGGAEADTQARMSESASQQVVAVLDVRASFAKEIR